MSEPKFPLIVNQLRKKRFDLEEAIAKLLNEFVDETNLVIKSIECHDIYGSKIHYTVDIITKPI